MTHQDAKKFLNAWHVFVVVKQDWKLYALWLRRYAPDLTKE